MDLAVPLMADNEIVRDPRTGEWYIVPVDPSEFMTCESCE